MPGRKLDRDERPRRYYTAVVRGRLRFPTDMLRHDRCWPRDTYDVDRMRYSDERGERSVRLASFSPFTAGRWASFGWRCEEE